MNPAPNSMQLWHKYLSEQVKEKLKREQKRTEFIDIKSYEKWVTIKNQKADKDTQQKFEYYTRLYPLKIWDHFSKYLKTCKISKTKHRTGLFFIKKSH